MSRVKEMISALRKCAKEHENEVGYTGQIVTSSLCRDVADYLEADRWHYPSKGEYPPKGRQILAYAWNVHNVLAKYDTFDGEDKFVIFDAYNGFIEIEKVIRWQYIVPPKENEK